jgi:hypothetical protein
VGGGDLLDPAAADAGEHHQRSLGPVVDDDAGVELADNVQLLFDQHLLDAKALDLDTEHGPGGLGRLVGGRGLFDAAQRGPPGHPGLGLDDHRPADLFGDGARLFRRRGHASLGNRDLGLLQQFLALVLVQACHPLPP